MTNHSLPSVSSNIPPDLRNWVDRVRETLDRVQVGQSNLTTIINNYTGSGDGTTPPGGGGPTPPPCGDPVSPTTPTGFELSAGFSGFMLSWDAPTYCGHSHTEVWGITEDSFGLAIFLGTSAGTMYSHIVGEPEAHWCFWIRHVNLLGDFGPFNDLAGLCGTTAVDPGYLIKILKGLITETELYQALGTRLDLIEITATAVRDESEIRQDADGAIALRTEQVGAIADGAAAGVTDITEARVGYCRYRTDLSTGSANYAARGTTTAHKDKTECLDPATGGAEREWLKGLPWATAVKQVSATTQGTCVINGVVDGTKLTEATCTGANGIWTPGRSAILEERFQTLQNADGTLSAQYTVKTDIGGHIAGFGLASKETGEGGVTSAFGVRADQFFIAGPTESTRPSTPYKGQAWYNTTDNAYPKNDTLYWTGTTWSTDSDFAAIPFIVQVAPIIQYAPAVLELTVDFINAVTTAGVSLSIDDGLTKTPCGVLTAPITPSALAASINAQKTIASAYVTSNGTRVTVAAVSANKIRVYRTATLYEFATNNTIINTIPAGVYMDDAYISNATITWAQIDKATIDWLDVIFRLRAAHIIAGSIDVDDCIQSSIFASGSTGWRICGNGVAEFQTAIVRGTVYATDGEFKGCIKGGNATAFGVGIGLLAGWVNDATGVCVPVGTANAVYKWRVGDPAGARAQWNGTAFTLANPYGQVILRLGGGDNYIKLGSATYSPDNFVLNGDTQTLTLKDPQHNAPSGLPVERVVLGRNPDTGDYGLTLRDADNNIVLSSGGVLGLGINQNQIRNSNFVSTVLWPFSLRSAAPYTTLDKSSGAWIPYTGLPDSNSITLSAAQNGVALYASFSHIKAPVSVQPGGRYEVSGYFCQHDCASAYLYIEWYDINTDGTPRALGVSTVKTITATSTAWTRVGGFAIAPAGATMGVLMVQIYKAAATPSCQLAMGRAYMGPAHANQNILTPWGPFVGWVLDGKTIGTYMESAAITNAYIADAAITTAKIGDAQVDTLKIAGNSVTVPVAWEGYSASITVNFPVACPVIVIMALDGGAFNYSRMAIDVTGATTGRLATATTPTVPVLYGYGDTPMYRDVSLPITTVTKSYVNAGVSTFTIKNIATGSYSISYVTAVVLGVAR